MMSLWDALRMNMMISYQELVRTFPKGNGDGLVLNMENVKETNGNRYLKCYKNKTCLLSWL
ncbi:hypothetical protein DQQ88_24055 [Salmonella enterica subsp. enterica serovar Kentucky]|nr:hypothetical protein [Salmonella enterica subsp. enterica serovar Kentucky]